MHSDQTTLLWLSGDIERQAGMDLFFFFFDFLWVKSSRPRLYKVLEPENLKIAAEMASYTLKS